jgi:hypothetical protein
MLNSNLDSIAHQVKKSSATNADGAEGKPNAWASLSWH